VIEASNNCVCPICNKHFHVKNSNVCQKHKNTCSLKCMGLYRADMYIGENNPNKKIYIKEDLFDPITQDSAYLLGWIASDGHISKSSFSIIIQIHQKDIGILKGLQSKFGGSINKYPSKKQVSLTFNSKKMVEAVCSLLSIDRGRKCDSVQFPVMIPKETYRDFIRGYFDGDGCIGSVAAALNRKGWPRPRAIISSSSENMLKSIGSIVNIPFGLYKNNLTYEGVNAIDFLGYIYDKSNLYLCRKMDSFLDWCLWVPGLPGNKQREGLGFRWERSRKDAIPPSKSKFSDSGFDLTLLEKIRTQGTVEIYDTGIKVQPPHGFYFDLVPRSSIIKTGYILGNSIGVIDASYTGPVLVPLIKINRESPELPLPSKIVQLIPRPIYRIEIHESSIEETERSDKGFGSTNKEIST
jgi:deoxyuridine 5'-triphosphate nucleotidohydrolase